ncbi:MAG: glutathione ABC transporter substrate-binding protein [Candidatus Eisenbacteria bacterium]|uniref:Glutathione ABC transporter substrate-binding protein n=1 Tax=Eiseniibacteriota bacterium TaxID=2212470 RepID=A0A937X9T2_UNCEI|nr:glutathione ABC transporter substrate-binding protein [Candidatus Eisenbacteria bacterium]
MTRLLIALVAVVALFYGGLGPASGGPATPAPVRGGSLVIAQGTDATTLDGHLYTDSPTASIMEHMIETLFSFEPDGRIVPKLATSYTASADGRTWTIKLRSGIRFHDGTPFNAEAVKFNLDRVLDPATRAAFRFLIDRVTEVTAVDDTTVRIVTNAPFAPMIAHLAHSGTGIQSPTAIRRLGADYSRSPVGTGLFKFREWVRGDRVVMTRNDDYWGEKAYLDEVTFRAIPEDGTRVLALEGGAVHVAVRVPPRDIERLEKVAGIRVDNTSSLRTIFVAFNTQRPPFNDKRVRQAINYAVNKRAIVGTSSPPTGALAGTARISDAPIAPNVQGYTSTMTYEWDMDKAKALLAEAGHGRGLSFTMHHPTGRYVRDAEIAAGIQALLRRVGVEARLVTMEFGTYVATIRGPKAIDEIQMGMLGWGCITGDADYGLYALFHSTQWPPNFNTAFYKNPRVDALLDQGRTTMDQSARDRIYKEAMKIIMDDAPWLFLHSESQVTGVRATVQGLIVHPTERMVAHRAWIRR